MCIWVRRFVNHARMWWAYATQAGSHPQPAVLRRTVQRGSKAHLKQALQELKRLRASDARMRG
jgi:hypothetical protein